MERLKATPESYARTIGFMESALRDRAHKKLLRNKNCKFGKNLERDLDMSLLYELGSETTLESVGETYGLTKERSRQIIEKFMPLLHSKCSPKTRSKFPLETILFNKPLSQASREKISSSRGGRALKMRDLMENGVRDPKKIADILDMKIKNVYNSVNTLDVWETGLTLERKNRSYEEIKREVKEKNGDEELRELLDGFSAGSLRGFIDWENRNSDQPVFALLGKALQDLGFAFDNAKFMTKILKEIGVPIRPIESWQAKRSGEHSQSYYVYYAKHKERVKYIINVIAALEYGGESKLKKVEIEQICGELSEDMLFPSTYDFRKHRDNKYRSAVTFIREIVGIHVPRIDNFIRDYSVPIFKYNNKYIFPISESKRFKKHIINRFKELSSKSH